MENPMLNLLQKQNPQNNGIGNFIRMLKGANNPMGMLQNMIASNPRMKQALDHAQQYGNSPKEAFYKLAQEKGVTDPEQYLRDLGLK